MRQPRRHGLCSASTLAGVDLRTDTHSSVSLPPGAAEHGCPWLGAALRRPHGEYLSTGGRVFQKSRCIAFLGLQQVQPQPGP